MRTKLLSLCIALLVGVSVWADDVWNYNVYDDCSKNGYKGGYAPAPADVQAVDLGLPSGLKWASCNVGAEKPEDYGNYYAWGEVLPKENYSWATYKYANEASSNKLTKYCDNTKYGDNGFTDNKTALDLEDDVAHVNWGGNWRMPTDDEWSELNNCTWTWVTQNGVNGYLVASKTNGNSIFLPAAGGATMRTSTMSVVSAPIGLRRSAPTTRTTHGTPTSIRTPARGAASIASTASLSALFANHSQYHRYQRINI